MKIKLEMVGNEMHCNLRPPDVAPCSRSASITKYMYTMHWPTNSTISQVTFRQLVSIYQFFG